MEFKALITRQIQQADESIRVSIESDTDIRKFKERVFESLDYTDNRANAQMMRLFEDTTLMDTFTEKEKEACTTVANLLFPNITPPSKPNLVEGVKFEFSKIMAGGESLTLQITEIKDYSSLNSSIRAIFDMLDTRLERTNTRELDVRSYLDTIDYETKLKVVMFVDLLYGRTTSDQLIQRLTSKELEEYRDKLNAQHLMKSINDGESYSTGASDAS